MAKPNATKVVSSALLGIDGETIIVNSKTYYIKPPTIKKIVGAGYYLSDFGSEQNVGDAIREMTQYEKLTKALSWFIQGDERLSEELMKGTLSEITEGFEVAVRLIDVRNFTMLSHLVKNVKIVIAKQR